MSKNNSKNNCGLGKIEKVGYHRKGYQRKGYIKKDGSVIPPTYVSAANVEPTCIKDMGKPGKGPKTLPKPNGYIRLSKYGYAIHKSKNQRRAALRAATKDYNTLAVLRRLNLLRNFQAIPENKEIFSNDVEYMKKLYSKIRRTKSKNKSLTQNGGDNDDDDNNNDNNDNNNNDNDNKQSDIEITTKISKSQVCNKNGICKIKNVIYESHVVDGKQIIFYTLDEDDIDDVYELDKKHCKSDKTKQDILDMIKKNKGYLIGVKADDKLQGYCHFDILNKSEVEIKSSCVNKGYSTALYTFVERFFQKNNYDEITTKINLNDPNFTEKINFQYGAGFLAYDSSDYDKEIYFRKEI